MSVCRCPTAEAHARLRIKTLGGDRDALMRSARQGNFAAPSAWVLGAGGVGSRDGRILRRLRARCGRGGRSSGVDRVARDGAAHGFQRRVVDRLAPRSGSGGGLTASASRTALAATFLRAGTTSSGVPAALGGTPRRSPARCPLAGGRVRRVRARRHALPNQVVNALGHRPDRLPAINDHSVGARRKAACRCSASAACRAPDRIGRVRGM